MQGAFAAVGEPVVSEATVKQLVELDPGNNSPEVILAKQQHNNRRGRRAQANNVAEQTVLIFLNY